MRRWLAVLAVGILFIGLTHPYWLGWAGDFLVEAGPPRKADAIMVLAGDSDGNRILKGAELAKAGYAPVVYVSGPRPMYGVSEAKLAIDDAVQHGYPERFFVALDVPSSSTEEEAAGMAPILRKRGVKSMLLVTSNYHTRRAGRIWRRIAKGINVQVVAAPDTFYTPEGWWKSRSGRKVAFFEWVKTLTGPLGV